MPRMIHALMATLLLAGTIFVSGPALAQESESTETSAGRQTNVLLTVRLGRLEGGKPTDVKSYNLVVVSGGPSSRLLSGARVPFPATAEDADDNDGMDKVHYVYQNIGFTTEAHAWVLGDGRIKLVANLEDSFVQKSEDPDTPPHVETRQVSVNAILKPGKPMEVTRVEGIRESSGFVEIEANILD